MSKKIRNERKILCVLSYINRHDDSSAFMEIDELETRYRDQIDLLLNELQTVSLLAVQLEARISQISTSIQDLSQVVETYIDDQRNSK